MNIKHIYNIPAALPFSETLVKYLLDLVDGDYQKLTRYRLLLPTRRACRIVQDTFLRLNDGKPMLLPHLMPLGEVDEDELSLLMFGQDEDVFEIPPAIAPLKRQLLLAKLIYAMDDFPRGFDGALKLSKNLCQFMDQVTVENLSFSDLNKIVPEDFASHWQLTLDFLKIVSEFWPQILAEEKVMDVAQRRNALLSALTEYWRQSPPDFPVIAAGSTGSIPAAAEILKVISEMEEGKVILPGVDHIMDDEAWQAITEIHPQHSLKLLLSRMDVERKDVAPLVEGNDAQSRQILASSVMLPAESTYQWRTFAQQHDLNAMLKGVEYYSCKTEQEEADVVAMVMREALEHKEKVTALVTPDRGLAQRVKGACLRWGIHVDDSAGEKLVETNLGKFILLSLSALNKTFDPVAFLALLKTGYCSAGFNEDEIKNAVRLIEKDVLRQRHVLPSHQVFLEKVMQHDDITVREYIQSVYEYLRTLYDNAQGGDKAKASDVLKSHISALEALAQKDEITGAARLWRGDIGKCAAQFFTKLMEHAHLIDDLSFSEYAEVVSSLLREETIRVPYGLHPRVLILGQLEARLTKADTIILGGLNEGSWTPDNTHDPWMSRPMRKDFGLPAIDQMIGFAAHDFVQHFCAQRVVMTRSEKQGGTPTVPSRWLERLDTILKTADMTLDDLSIHPYRQWVQVIDDAEVKPFERPAPMPPVSARPRSVSVTKIEKWLQDPYAIYMHYVLRLRKLDPLRQDVDAALKGNLLHEVLDQFVQKYPDDLPAEAEDEFLDIARSVITAQTEDSEVLHFWWPKLIRIADAFVAYERTWREGAKFYEAEAKGNFDIPIADQTFNLYGVADRIDKLKEGYAIIDYKSGGTFSKSRLASGGYPQLPLEALILKESGFDGRGFKGDKEPYTKKPIPAGKTNYVGYWKLTGGSTPAEYTVIDENVSDTVEIVKEGLERLIETFWNPDTPFYCIPNAQNAPRFNDYEHVSRLKEWSVLDNDAEGGASD